MSMDFVVSDQAIIQIIGNTLKEFDEIEGLGSDFAKELIDIFDREEVKRGIKIKRKNGRIFIDLLLRVYYLSEISRIAKRMRERIKENLEKLTNCKLEELNIYVIDVEDKSET